MSDKKQTNKILATVLAAVLVWVANKAVVEVWKKTVGNDPRHDIEDELPLSQILAFAGITSLVTGVVRVLTVRTASKALARGLKAKPVTDPNGDVSE